MHTVRHLLTPGTPVYGLLKLAAVGLLVGLYATRARGHKDPQPAATEDAPPPRPQKPHPVSKKKKRKRR